MLLKWTFVVLVFFICERFVNGYSANPYFEDLDLKTLEECGELGCLVTKPGDNLPAICKVPGISSSQNVTFIIENVRIVAQRLGQSDLYKAPGYTVKESDHLKRLTCEVTELAGTGSSEVQAKLFIAKASTRPEIQEKGNGKGLALRCFTRYGRPPPELEFTVDGTKLEHALQNGDEAIEFSSADELHGKNITCCTKSPFYPTSCSDHTISEKVRKPEEPELPEGHGATKSTTNGALSNVISMLTCSWSIMTSFAIMISF
ncbi:uncharacterized protein LOC127860244 isoform X2 [Dreissena polymorpha]|uniref:uncharacterized protein LOC127860244 isoform X2 n=1 Tax=Dreissena polymorpha TaxID=45954 RepID=UPI0022655261|nr:uncharacterized protein LOC127860244 isoform X2 [Dreissena polymorpha]